MFSIKKFLLFMLSGMLFLSRAASAQEDVPPPADFDKSNSRNGGEIVITATKTEIDKRETGASITIITEKEIEEKGKRNVADLLREVPGLSIIRSGPFGGNADIFIRGAKTANVLVLIDGVVVNDPMGIGKVFDFANLSTLNIERIEIIRGPQSTLYGSDAIGGVINIITKKGTGKAAGNLTVEAGAYSTFREAFTLSGGESGISYSFGIARTDSKGISIADKQKGAAQNPERDSYRNYTLSSRMGIELPLKSRVNFSFNYNDTAANIDDGAYDDDADYIAYTKVLASRTELVQDILPFWNHRLSYSYSSTTRKYRDKADAADPTFVNSSYGGTLQKVEWQNNFPLIKQDTVTVGIDYSFETGSSLSYDNYFGTPSTTQFDEKNTYTTGIYAQNHLKLWDRFFLILGGRQDDHKTFGIKRSYQSSLSVILPYTETRLKGNCSTGFKAPALSYLYDTSMDANNPNLKPEKNRSYDFGFEQPLLNERINLGVSCFRNNYTNMIDFIGGKYENVGRAWTQGAESEVKLSLPYNIKLFTNYTYTETRDQTNKKELVRRPRHQSASGLNWEFISGAQINLTAYYVGKRKDVYYDSMWVQHDVTQREYLRFDVFLSYQVLEYLQVFARAENLTDRHYQEVYGFSTSGRSVYAGLRGSF